MEGETMESNIELSEDIVKVLLEEHELSLGDAMLVLRLSEDAIIDATLDAESEDEDIESEEVDVDGRSTTINSKREEDTNTQ
jgi:hypothetical protein